MLIDESQGFGLGAMAGWRLNPTAVTDGVKISLSPPLPPPPPPPPLALAPLTVTPEATGVAAQIVTGGGAVQVLPPATPRKTSWRPAASTSKGLVVPSSSMAMWKKVAIGLAIAVPVGYLGYKFVKGKKGPATP